MESNEIKINTQNKLPKSVAIISIFLLVLGILSLGSTLIGLLFNNLSIYAFATKIFAFHEGIIALAISSIISIFLSFKIRKMKKIYFYITLAFLLINLIPAVQVALSFVKVVSMGNAVYISPETKTEMLKFVFNPFLIIELIMLIYLWISWRKFS